MLAKTLAGKSGTVVAISVDTAAGWSTARMAGSSRAWRRTPDLKLVGPINTGIEPGQMYNAIQNAMTANPDAIAIASVDCCSIDGAAKWAETAGKNGKVLVIGTDALKQTLNYIKNGTRRVLDQPEPGRSGVSTATAAAQGFRRQGHAAEDGLPAAAAHHQGERRHRHARGMTASAPARSPLAVSASGLCKRFAGVTALDDVTLDVRAGAGHGRGG